MLEDDFRQFSDEQIAAHILTQDWGETISETYMPGLLGSLTSGKAVIERRAYGYAVIFPLRLEDIPLESGARKAKRTVLETLFVAKSSRGTGIADAFLDELKSQYDQWPLYLVCFHQWRCDFFSRNGFSTVATPTQEVFCMEYWGGGALARLASPS